MLTITGLDDFPTALSQPIALADGRDAIACVHQRTPETDEIAYSAAYLVTQAGTAEKVGESEPYGKDIAVAIQVKGRTLIMWVTEPPPAGGGADAQLHRYEFAIDVGVPDPVDLPARRQANAATRMAKLALDQVALLDTRLDALEG